MRLLDPHFLFCLYSIGFHSIGAVAVTSTSWNDLGIRDISDTGKASGLLIRDVSEPYDPLFMLDSAEQIYARNPLNNEVLPRVETRSLVLSRTALRRKIAELDFEIDQWDRAAREFRNYNSLPVTHKREIMQFLEHDIPHKPEFLNARQNERQQLLSQVRTLRAAGRTEDANSFRDKIDHWFEKYQEHWQLMERCYRQQRRRGGTSAGRKSGSRPAGGGSPGGGDHGPPRGEGALGEGWRHVPHRK